MKSRKKIFRLYGKTLDMVNFLEKPVHTEEDRKPLPIYKERLEVLKWVLNI